MDRRITTLVAVAVFGLVCLAPMIAEESAAKTIDVRLSTAYIYTADFEIIDVSVDDSCIYLIDGSANYAAMTAYLKDPRGVAPPTGDDRSQLKANIGKTVHVYEVWRWDNDPSIYYGNQWKDGTLCLKPYNVEKLFEGDVEDIVKLKVNSVTDYTGKKLDEDHVYVYPKGENERYQYVYTGTTVKFVIEKDSSFYIKPQWSDVSLYYNLNLDVEISKPNGSATAFMAACFVISAITIALLAFGALKPKWSK